MATVDGQFLDRPVVVNISIVGGPTGAGTPTPVPGGGNNFITEDGDYLLGEDGDLFLTEDDTLIVRLVGGKLKVSRLEES